MKVREIRQDEPFEVHSIYTEKIRIDAFAPGDVMDGGGFPVACAGGKVAADMTRVEMYQVIRTLQNRLAQ